MIYKVILTYDIGPTEVADHAMAFILTFARRIISPGQAVRTGHWIKAKSDIPKLRSPMFRLNQVILGIVGGGRIGSSSRDKLAFAC